jgi:hypothetical protein
LTCAFEVGFSDWFGLLAGAYLPLGFGVKAGRGQGGVMFVYHALH